MKKKLCKAKFEIGDKIYIANGFDRNQSRAGVILSVQQSFQTYWYSVKVIRSWGNTMFYTVTNIYEEKDLGKLGPYNVEYDWLHSKKEYEFLDKIDTLSSEED